MKDKYYLLIASFLLFSCVHQPIIPIERPKAPIISLQTEERCILAKGKPVWVVHLDGSGQGMCQLSNGKRCDEWALLYGHCITDNLP